MKNSDLIKIKVYNAKGSLIKDFKEIQYFDISELKHGF